jgi:hypothetical protein
LEGGTKDEIQIFDIPFKGVSTRFGLRTIEKYIENLDFLFCSSFRNLRLGGVKFDKRWSMLWFVLILRSFRTFQSTRQMFEHESVVLNVDEFSEMSERLGKLIIIWCR